MKSILRRACTTLIGVVVLLINLDNAPARAVESPSRGSVRPQAVATYGRVPALFVENLGQTHADVRYFSRGSGIPVFFTAGDVRLVLTSGGRRAALALEFVGAQPAGVEGRRPSAATVSHIRGTTATTSTSYGEVIYRDAWPGIDALFRDDGGKLTYEFLVHPGARVDDIRLRFSGVEGVRLADNGDLIIGTPVGALTDTAPVSFQGDRREQRRVASRFVVHAVNEVGFVVDDYDRSRPLLIDPSILYSTFLGSSGEEIATSIAVDTVGAAYVTGSTTAHDFPVRTGVLGPDATGFTDVFVAKIAPQGTAFEYITIIGGHRADDALAIAIDNGGHAYVVGASQSDDYPRTPGNFAGARWASVRDGFISKLNAQGTALLFSTVLGANSATSATAVAVDAAGHIHIGGTSTATNLPLTSGAVHGDRGVGDGFVLKINGAGSSVLYGTYLGGAGDDHVQDLTLDSAGNTYIVGTTSSGDFPTSTGAHSRTLYGSADAFATKLNTAASTPGTAMFYSTYVGGPGYEVGQAIDVDPTRQEAYLALNGDYTQYVFPPGGTAGPVFVKLSSTGSSLLYVTDAGPDDTGRTNVYDLKLGSDGYVYAGGIYSEEAGIAWVSRIDPRGWEAGRVTLDGEFLAGESVHGLAIDHSNAIYAAGMTNSASFPVTSNAPQRRFGGGYSDAFVAKISFADMGGADIAGRKPAQASSLEGSQYAAANAFDRNFATRWSSQFSDPQWLTVDLGQRYHVDRVVLHWETAYGAKYELHISDDGVNWYPLRYRVLDEEDSIYPPDVEMDGGVDNHINLDGSGRYLRVFGLERGTPWGYSLWEVEVYGTPAATPAPAPGTINLAYGARVWSSSFERLDLLWHNAVDGQLQTRWSSEFADPQWIAVDLGAQVNISRAVLRWETAYGRDYQLQVSNDGETWQTVRSVTGGDGGVDDLTGLSATGRYVRMYGTARGTPWGYSLWEFEVYGVIGGSPTPPPPPPTSSEIVLYATDVAALHNLSLVADSSAAGGKKISSVDAGWSSTEQPPPPNTAPFAIFAIDVRERGTYRLWMRMRGHADSKWNESVWVQYRTTTGASPYPWGTTHGLLVNLENCSGCGIQGWGWQDNSWWLNQPSGVLLETGVHYLYVTLREDGVEFDQIVLSKDRYLHSAPGPVKNDSTIVSKPGIDVAESRQGTIIVDGSRGEMNVTGPDGFSLSTVFSTSIGNTVGGIWECGPQCQPGKEVSLFGRWLGGDLTGTVTWRGTTYANVGSQASNSSAELVLGGSVKLPPASTADRTVTVPFAAAGQLQLSDGTVTRHFHHRGGGTATLTLRYSPATNSWSVVRAELTFH